jgi:hypothetical protein
MLQGLELRFQISDAEPIDDDGEEGPREKLNLAKEAVMAAADCIRENKDKRDEEKKGEI